MRDRGLVAGGDEDGDGGELSRRRLRARGAESGEEVGAEADGERQNGHDHKRLDDGDHGVGLGVRMALGSGAPCCDMSSNGDQWCRGKEVEGEGHPAA